jgi:hypothetical protein
MNANNIVDTLPIGYRWANELECERWTHPVYFSRMVQVRKPEHGPDATDLAIRS